MKTPTILLAVTLALASCGKEESSTLEPTTPASTTSVDSFMLATAPEGAESISKVRENVTVGDEVIIEGKVMGRVDPFVDSRAMVVIGDPAKITSCDLIPGDSCPTPWDVCCDDKDVIKQSIATVQILDEEGNLIKEGIKGVNDIEELSNLVVKGTIAEGSNDDNLLINASGIYHKK